MLLSCLLMGFALQPCFPQTWYGSLRSHDYRMVMIHPDTAWVEGFTTHHQTYKKLDDVLIRNSPPDSGFTGKTFRMSNSKGRYHLHLGNKKIPLYRSIHNPSPFPLHEDYMVNQLKEITDSLAGPFDSLFPTPPNLFHPPREMPYPAYVARTRRILDSLTARFSKGQNPQVAAYYRQIDSLHTLDTARIVHLLAQIRNKSNPKKPDFYSNKLLLALSHTRPGDLIGYLDKNPPNRATILNHLDASLHREKMVKGLKTCPLKSSSKKEIIKRNRQHIRRNVAAGVVYSALVVSEIALIAALLMLL